ncbi:hypothetical protein PFFVO_02571 [Plasmodium falciparum Vietnam Oak-Knoll (FVO)]|uniref:Uncharacterized protein n=1 Tax=Plasmodium falciparum Vietnam Oak-Knoll (FVO) TaxID=1036723 RepID=A0A024V932_PLAFA|nr:hypothetical protein PFFVO_02571 [Plasmodium falciparum Vietnam Oak-Knoll (FVO)]
MYRSLNNDFYYFSLSNRIRPFKIHSTNTKFIFFLYSNKENIKKKKKKRIVIYEIKKKKKT